MPSGPKKTKTPHMAKKVNTSTKFRTVSVISVNRVSLKAAARKTKALPNESAKAIKRLRLFAFLVTRLLSNNAIGFAQYLHACHHFSMAVLSADPPFILMKWCAWGSMSGMWRAGAVPNRCHMLALDCPDGINCRTGDECCGAANDGCVSRPLLGCLARQVDLPRRSISAV